MILKIGPCFGILFEIPGTTSENGVTQKCKIMTTIILSTFYFILAFLVYRVLAYFYDDSKEYSKGRKIR